jgi:DNA polymerase-1
MRELSFPVNGQAVPVHVVLDSADLELFRAWISDQTGAVAVDSESCGLDIYGYGPDYLRLVQFGTAHEAWILPVEMGAAFKVAARWALEVLPWILGHNWAGFDALVFDKHLGVPLEMLCAKATDTKILASLVDPRQPQEGGIGTGLKPLSAYYVDPSAPDTQGDLTAVFRSLGLTKATGWAGIPLDHPTYLSYAGGDVILTSRLEPYLRGSLNRLRVRDALVEYEHEIARICAVMQRKGMLLDEEYTRELGGTLSREALEYSEIAARYGVESVNSNRQLAEALTAMGEEIGATPETRTAGGAPKLDKPVLLSLADLNPDWQRVGARTPNPLADAVLHAKRAGKWQSAYVDTFLETKDAYGRIHPSINPMQARTARMSITRPALQTLPSGDWSIRRCMLSDPGHVFVSTDFQAIEMRVLAALADVTKMKHGFQNADSYPKDLYPDGFDIHMFTARLVKGPNATKAHRKTFKAAGLGKIFGGGKGTLARQTGAPESEIQNVLTEFDRQYPEIRQASNRWQREARQNGMVALSATGRRLPLDRDRMYAVVNYRVQSSARDCLGQAMLHMEEAGLLDYMSLPIHDEILASVPKGEAEEIGREFAKCMTFDLYGVPIQAAPEIGGRSWGSLYGADF